MTTTGGLALEEALARAQASERLYRMLAEHMLDVVWVGRPDGTFSYVSPSVLRLRGYTAEEVLGQTMMEALAPSSRAVIAELQQRLGEALARGESPRHEVRLELEQPCKDGSTVWTECFANLVYDEDGRFAGVLGVSRDISARRRADEERARATSALQEALDQVRTLRGLLPMCARCKRIRDDEGGWRDVETVLAQRTEAQVSHGLCPHCAEVLYPGLL